MQGETLDQETLKVAERPISAADYVRGIDSYLDDAEKEKILRPDQDVIFHDIQTFFREGSNKGYVTAPTGTGKTVIFVELSKALVRAGEFAGRTPRILVVEPTKDLVHQTMGRTGEKGYGKFAPGLNLSSYFSDSTAEDLLNLENADIVVTTYDSLSLMRRRDVMREISDEEKLQSFNNLVVEIAKNPGTNRDALYEELEALEFCLRGVNKISTGRRLFDMFDVVILDEAHHVLGATMAALVDDIGKEKTVIGFTATPNANEKKRLDKHLPVKIHDLTFQEAISLELLAPIAGIGVRTGVKIQGHDLFDKEGDYQDEKLAYLANINSRNQLAVNITKILVEHGFGTLIPCIAGGGALHPRVLASELNAAGVSAEAIYGGVPSGQRNKIYERFEAGKVDALTNIRILGEGYDSKRAKASLELSPTRSNINKRQRIGRVVRPGSVALVVEIVDDYDKLNPPLHLPDMLDLKTFATGQIYGNPTEEDRERIEQVVKAIGEYAVMVDQIPADYTRLSDTMSEYQAIVNGRVRTAKSGHYSTSEKISPLYAGLTDEILAQLWQSKGVEPDVVLGRQDYNIRILYEAGRSVQFLRELPECDIYKAYVVNDERWMSAEGFALGFKNKYPKIDSEIIEERLQELGTSVTWRPLKMPAYRRVGRSTQEFEVFKAYKADPDTIKLLGRQLEDYFKVIGSI